MTPENNPESMVTKADLARLEHQLKIIAAKVQPAALPIKIKTAEVLKMTQYRSRSALLRWANRHRIKPTENGRLWSRSDVEQALRNAPKTSNRWSM